MDCARAPASASASTDSPSTTWATAWSRVPAGVRTGSAQVSGSSYFISFNRWD